MARADLLLDLVRAGARGDQALFRRALEALIAEEPARQPSASSNLSQKNSYRSLRSAWRKHPKYL